MALTDLPILGMLRTRMQWAQARQGLIAENVANADMPGFKPRDLAELRFDRATGSAVTASPMVRRCRALVLSATIGGWASPSSGSSSSTSSGGANTA